ncbi:MAG: hypothetical protein AB8G22_02850 [Saprospiraceae bacterium]
MHGNNKRNRRKHHLYQIEDNEDNDIYKYGICGRSLKKDGTSRRADQQVNLFNRVVGWVRFSATVLLTNIQGRSEAEDIERKYIEDYKKTNGRYPRGNQ